jgi:hypothetical protein
MQAEELLQLSELNQIIDGLYKERKIASRVYRHIKNGLQSYPTEANHEKYNRKFRKDLPKWIKEICIKPDGNSYGKTSRYRVKQDFDCVMQAFSWLISPDEIPVHPPRKQKALTSISADDNALYSISQLELIRGTFINMLIASINHPEGKPTQLTTWFCYFAFSLICWGGWINKNGYGDLLDAQFAQFSSLLGHPVYKRAFREAYRRIPVDHLVKFCYARLHESLQSEDFVEKTPIWRVFEKPGEGEVNVKMRLRNEMNQMLRNLLKKFLPMI